MGNFQKYWLQNVGQDFIVLDFFVGGRLCEKKRCVGEINVSRAWDPVHAGDKALKRETPAKRGRVNRYASSVGNMLQHLEWHSLQDRRKDSRLNMFYKIVNNKVEIQKTDRLIPQKRQTWHSHTKSFQIPSCKTEYRKEYFFPRTITDWNKLLENMINSTSLDSFKSSISKLHY
jgi:hypothetical protein